MLYLSLGRHTKIKVCIKKGGFMPSKDFGERVEGDTPMYLKEPFTPHPYPKPKVSAYFPKEWGFTWEVPLSSVKWTWGQKLVFLINTGLHWTYNTLGMTLN